MLLSPIRGIKSLINCSSRLDSISLVILFSNIEKNISIVKNISNSNSKNIK